MIFFQTIIRYFKAAAWGLFLTAALFFSACDSTEEKPAAPPASESKAAPGRPVPEAEYAEFWIKFPGFFPPSKWYEDEDAEKAKKDSFIEKELARRFEAAGLSLEPQNLARLTAFRQALLAQLYFDTEVSGRINVQDETLKKYYEENREKFFVPETVDLGHIFVKAPEEASEKEIKKAKEKIETAREAIKTGKLDFEEAARKYSETASAEKGGRAGALQRGKILKILEDAAFALEPGETSAVIRSRHGFHILKAFDHKPGRYLPFDQAKDELRRRYRAAREELIKETLLFQAADGLPPGAGFAVNALDATDTDTVVVKLPPDHYTLAETGKRAAEYDDPPPPPELWPELWPYFFERELLAFKARREDYEKRRDFKRIMEWTEDYVRANEYLEKEVYEDIRITRAELRRYYRENKSRFINYKKSRTLVVEYRPEAPGSPAARHYALEEAKQKMKTAFRGVASAGEFRRAAEDFVSKHEDARLYDTGLIIAAKKGRLYDMAVEKLDEGETSEPILTPMGLMMIYCVKRIPTRIMSFEEAREKARAGLMAEKKARARSGIENEILKKIPAARRGDGKDITD